MRVNDRLFRQIKGGIYHSTSVSGYRAIRSSGHILPNSGQFPFSHGQSPHSCCYKIVAISLLDLRQPARPLVGQEAWRNWTTFLTNHEPITVLLDLAPDSLSEPLHDFDSLQKRFPFGTMVAEAEKCYPGPISFAAVRRCILVCAKWHTIFRIIPGNEISDIDFSRTEAQFDRKWERVRPKSNGPVLGLAIFDELSDAITEVS
jgi:hypothetical protein